MSNAEKEVKTKRPSSKFIIFFLNFHSPVTLEASYKISYNLGVQQKKSRRKISGSLVQMIINFRGEERIVSPIHLLLVSENIWCIWYAHTRNLRQN